MSVVESITSVILVLAKQLVFNGSHRCCMGARLGAVAPGTQGRTTTHDESSRGPRRHLLPVADRVPVAPDSPTLSSVGHCIPLLPNLEERRRLGLHPGSTLRADTSASGSV